MTASTRPGPALGPHRARPDGPDARRLRRYLHEAHHRFASTGDADPAVRPLVADSWRRSVASGLDPEALAVVRLAEDALADIRAAHPLTEVMPVVRRLLVEDAADAGLLVAVSDAAGQLLFVEGDHRLRTAAESMHFVPGADWSEASAGTNAPGTALALDRPVQIRGPEHLSRRVAPWSCSAAPIHDPDTGAMLGVLDVTGSDEVATPHALQLVRATAAAAEAELRIARLTSGGSRGRTVRAPHGSPRLAVLGRHAGVLTHGSTSIGLSVRHSEMLLMLAAAPAGLTAAEVAVGLSEADQASVTVRAAFSRLRGLLGPVRLSSRPYRLQSALDTDVAEVRALLARAETRRAVASYAGPLLPGSTAPAVVRLRDELHAAVRATVLGTHDADTALSFADTPHGRDDYEVWQHALAVLPPGSPRRPQVVGHLSLLDRELA